MSTWEITTGLYGQTKNQQWTPFPGNPALLTAIGGEFRVILTSGNEPPTTETRFNKDHKNVFCLVFAQNENTRTAVGLGNPFFQSKKEFHWL